MSKYSVAKITSLLNQSDSAPTADEKGAKLEDLGVYIFNKLDGISFYDKNILDGPRAHELDIAFWNQQNPLGLSFLDPIVIVECKNTGIPLGSHGVGWFVRKLQDRGATNGIIISLSGITGEADGESNAHSEVLSALMRDKIKIILLDREEILKLTTTDDLVSIMMNKYLILSLYRTIL